jgi:hypothetical protein
MAYIHGDGYPGTEKQRGAAGLVKDQLAGLEGALSGLAPREQAGFMSAYIDGLIQMGEAIRARNGHRSQAPGFVQKSARKTPVSAGRTAQPARKDPRVASKSRCSTCNKKLKASWAACPRCAKPNLRRSQKAARVMITKTAARGGAGAWCVSGHWTPGARGPCCATCGGLMVATDVPPLAAVKSSAVADNYWKRELGSSSDPAQRLVYEQARWGTGQNGRLS